MGNFKLFQLNNPFENLYSFLYTISMNGNVVDFNIFNVFIKPLKPKLMKTINEFSFYYISEIKDEQSIFQKLKNSNHIFVSYYALNLNDGIFVIGWKETLIIFKNSLLPSFKSIFSTSSNILIYFLPNTKESFCKYLNI